MRTENLRLEELLLLTRHSPRWLPFTSVEHSNSLELTHLQKDRFTQHENHICRNARFRGDGIARTR